MILVTHKMRRGCGAMEGITLIFGGRCVTGQQGLTVALANQLAMP